MSETRHDRMMRRLKIAAAEIQTRPLYDPKFRPTGEAAQDAFDRDMAMDELGDDDA